MIKNLFTFILILLLTTDFYGQSKPYRVGTTAASFLEMGVGAGISMGEAYVSVARDVSAIYWNPSGLAYMDANEAQFMIRPWIADINTSFAGVAANVESIGTFGLSIMTMDFGKTEVTTMDMQDGTGEMYSAMDYAISLAFARKLADWFAFGITAKYIVSQISRLQANALALDLGVMVETPFFSPDGNHENGLTLGMSISNYGTQMKYDGIELLTPIDILPDENGNYKDLEGMYRLQSWDLPIIFRLGAAYHPIVTGAHKVTLAVDALHPNNNSESVNLGGEYQLTTQGYGRFMVRAGYHGLFMDDSQFGLTLGGGVQLMLLNNVIIKLDFSYQDLEYFNNYYSYSVGIEF